MENKKPPSVLKIIEYIVFVVIIIVGVYIWINFPALKEKYSYNSDNEKALAIIPNKDAKISQSFRLFFLDTVGNYPGTGLIKITPSKTEEPAPNEEPAPTENNNSQQQNSGVVASRDYNNYLFIPTMGVKAPIIWDTSLDEATMLANLRNGVIHYLGTAKPGEKAPDGNGEGNIFIAGHSSYYRSDLGKYKTIFANLDRMETGNQLAIVYNSQIYVYTVTEKKVVMPEDVSVLSQETNKPTLSLMTCVPVGTNEKRLIVRAEFAGFAE